MSQTLTLTQQYAAELAKGVVPGILKAIKAAKRDTRLIVAAVLAITYYHQAHWLSTIDGIGHLGYAIPLVVDLAMLRMLGIVQTVGMRQPAKTGALVLTGFLAAMSGAVNVAAPGAIAARMIFGALVVMAAGVKVVTALVGPDLDAMEAQETTVAATVAPTVDLAEQARVDAERAKRQAAAAKGAATKRANAQRLADEKAAKAEERRQRREELKAMKAAESAALFARIAVETDEHYVDGVAPSSAIPVA